MKIFNNSFTAMQELLGSSYRLNFLFQAGLTVKIVLDHMSLDQLLNASKYFI